MATSDVKVDIIDAQQKGQDAMNLFIDDRLVEHAEVEFFQPIKKMKLKTFINMKKTVKVSVKDKVVPIRSHSNLFGQLALIMQTRNVNLKEIFEYPLGPYPWSLCGDMGELRKTNKSSLMHILEKDVETEETVDGSYVTITDGMAAVQKLKTTGKTFGEYSDNLLKVILSLGKDATRIDVVFDVYKDESIKNAEQVSYGTTPKQHFSCLTIPAYIRTLILTLL